MTGFDGGTYEVPTPSESRASNDERPLARHGLQQCGVCRLEDGMPVQVVDIILRYAIVVGRIRRNSMDCKVVAVLNMVDYIRRMVNIARVWCRSGD